MALTRKKWREAGSDITHIHKHKQTHIFKVAVKELMAPATTYMLRL